MGKRVDVTVEREFRASPEVVAAVMFDASREPAWMRAVEAAGPAGTPAGVGSRAWQKGRFLGKEIRWETEVTKYEPARLLSMRIDGGPFRGSVSYRIERVGSGSRVAIRNEGEPTAFGWMPSWLIAKAMRGAMGADLTRLQQLVESGGGTNGPGVP